MEVASLVRYIGLRTGRSTQDQVKRARLFFTPMEELHGSNIFARLSNNYRVIQPYLDMIDPDFIQSMNDNVKNIALYVDPKRDLIAESYAPAEAAKEDAQATKPVGPSAHKASDNTELFC